MITFTNVNPNKLLDEFASKGAIWINATNDLQYDENGIAINYVATLNVEFVSGTDMVLVQEVFDAHDPTPLPQPPTLEEQLAEKDAQILKLKEEQYRTQQMTIQNTETQQELIELLMMMGVI